MAQENKFIHEVIVTTITPLGAPHSAPMGVLIEDENIIIQPFKPSSTYQNLKHHRQCSINFTDDVRIFAGALTGHRDWPMKACETIEGFYLAQALSHSELNVVRFEDNDPRAYFVGEVKKQVMHRAFTGFNRAQNAVVEAAILISRIDRLPEKKIRQELNYLKIAIDKTAGNREAIAWQWLMEKVAAAGIKLSDD